jgi:chemotaxis signal transduction protein
MVNDRDAARAGTAEELRRRFDDSFSAPSLSAGAEAAPLLALRIDDDLYALRLGEIRGFSAARKILPLPSATPSLLGLVGLRGVVVPVFSLRVLLGYGGGDEHPRWFVVCGEAEPIALAFADFDGYLQRATSEIRPAGEAERTHVREVLRIDGALRAVIALESVKRAIESSVGPARQG